MDKVSMFHTFIPTQYMKENVLLCSNLDRYDVKRIYLGSSSKAMAGSEKKRGKMEIQKFKYLENGKSLLDEIKYIFQSF